MKRFACMAVLAALLSGRATGEIVWENARFKLVLGEDATWRSLVDKQAGTERCHAPLQVAMAAVTIAPPQGPLPAGEHTSVHDHQKALAQAPPRRCNAIAASYVDAASRRVDPNVNTPKRGEDAASTGWRWPYC